MPFHSFIVVAAASLYLISYTTSLFLVLCVHNKTYQVHEWDRNAGSCTGSNVARSMMMVLGLFYLLVIVLQVIVLVLVGEAWLNPSNDLIESALVLAAVNGSIAGVLVIAHFVITCTRMNAHKKHLGWLWMFTSFIAKSLLITGVVGISQAVILSEASLDYDNDVVTETYLTCIDVLRDTTVPSVTAARCASLVSSILVISFRTMLLLVLISLVTTRMLEHSQFAVPLSRGGKAHAATLLPVNDIIVPDNDDSNFS